MAKKLGLEVAGDALGLVTGAVRESSRRTAECEQEEQQLCLDRARRGAHLGDERLRAAGVLEIDARLALLRATSDAPGVEEVIRKLKAKRRRLLRATSDAPGVEEVIRKLKAKRRRLLRRG